MQEYNRSAVCMFQCVGQNISWSTYEGFRLNVKKNVSFFERSQNIWSNKQSFAKRCPEMYISCESCFLDQLICFCNFLFDKVWWFQNHPLMSIGVISHLMTFFYDTFDQLGIFYNFLSNNKKSCLYMMFSESLEYFISILCGSIIKSQSNNILISLDIVDQSSKNLKVSRLWEVKHQYPYTYNQDSTYKNLFYHAYITFGRSKKLQSFSFGTQYLVPTDIWSQ